MYRNQSIFNKPPASTQNGYLKQGMRRPQEERSAKSINWFFFMHFVRCTNEFATENHESTWKQVFARFYNFFRCRRPIAQSLVALRSHAKLLAMLSHLFECLFFYLSWNRYVLSQLTFVNRQCIMMTSYLPSPSLDVTNTRALNRQNF